MDFIGPCPEENGFNAILSITDRLGADCRILATRTDITSEDLAVLFFDGWVCENGVPLHITMDRDKLFVSKFWKSLSALMGVDLRMSSAYHPQTDGSSERFNQTINQCLRFHVERNQRGWSRALPRVRFDIMQHSFSALKIDQLKLTGEIYKPYKGMRPRSFGDIEWRW